MKTKKEKPTSDSVVGAQLQVIKFWALKLGFTELQHFTIGDSLIYDLGRNRHLSLSNAGSPNEMLMICERDDKNPKLNSDVIVLHNYDYDGYLTKEKLETLINALRPKSL